MSKPSAEAADKEKQPEHDFSAGVCGKHFRRYQRGTNVAVLEPNVARIFPNAEMKNYQKLRERCVMPELFQGWKMETTLEVIKETFENEPEWMLDNILKKDFPRNLAEEQQAAGKWSYGYCYYIAEVTTLIFDAIPLSYQRLFKKHKKEARKYATHWVLKAGDFCFDPEEGCPMPAAKYSDYSTRNFTPQHPSRNAIKLFIRILQHCINNGRFNFRQQEIAKQFIADFSK